MSKRPRPQIHEFNIAWICALPIEVDAARLVLDDEYDDFHEAADYVLGQIGRHKVVIACPPAGRIGIGSAANTAQRTKSLFPAIQSWLMVGIGGGVPSASNDIRLGDVVISQPHGAFGGVVQYDMGKTLHRGERSRTGFLNAPPQDLLIAVSKTRSNINIGRSRLFDTLGRIASNPVFARPESSSDILFESSYQHVDSRTPSKCSGCDLTKISERQHRRTDDIAVHYGLIASGNQVIRSGLERDTLSQELGGVLCFEMEAAGLMNDFSCLVIRGICDYADSHKNKAWQPFAAAAAASCAREVLSCVSSSLQSPSLRRESSNGSFFIPPSSRTSSQLETEVERFVASPSPEQLEIPRHNHFTLTQSTLSEDQRQIYFESLMFDQLESRHLSIRTAQSTTCRWLLKRQEYVEWRNDEKLEDHHGFLWIKGKAATGKSTMVKFLLSQIKRTKAADVIVAFFFNARGEAIERSTLGMYRSLLYQLLEQRPELKRVFDHRLTRPNDEGSVDWEIDTLRILLQLAVQQLGQTSLICLVDALDECNDDEALEMVTFFEELGSNASNLGIKIRVLLSSRHYPYITVKKGIELVLEDQTEHGEDIVEYIRSKLDEGQTKKTQKIRDEIVKRASGIFLWVVLVVDILNKEHRRGRLQLHNMEKRLREVPNDIEKLFDDILDRGGPCCEESVICFQWVLYAKQPLKLEELYFAIRSSLADSSTIVKSTSEDSREDMRVFVLDVSRGLLEETKSKAQTVQFIHETVREFFLRGRVLDKPPFAPPETFTARSHDSLKSCCEAYYLQAHLQIFMPKHEKGTSAATVTYENRKEITKLYPFLEYAVKNVLFHCDVAEREGFPQDDFLANFDKHKWIDLSNLFQRHKNLRYLPGTSMLCILADQHLLALSKKKLLHPRVLTQLDSRHRWLVVAGLVSASSDYLEAMKTWLCQLDTEQSSSPPALPPSFVESESAVQEATRLLRDKRRDISGKTRNYPLFWAVLNGHRAMLELIIATGHDFWSAYTDNAVHHQDLLLLTVSRGQLDVFKVLLEYGRIIPNYWIRVLMEIPMAEQADIMRIFLKRLGNESKGSTKHEKLYEFPAFLTAILAEDFETIEWMVCAYGVSINQTDALGRSLLSYAVLYGDLRVIDLLLTDVNCETNIVDKAGHGLLSYAAFRGHLKITQRVLKLPDVNINHQDRNGRVPLYLASAKHLLIDAPLNKDTSSTSVGKTQVVDLLLGQHDVKVNLPDNRGRTALMAAIRSCHIEAVTMLVAHEIININAIDKTGKDPATYAASTGDLKILELILNHRRYYHHAKQRAIVNDRLLRDIDSPTNKRPNALSEMLFRCVEDGHSQVLSLLLDQNVDNVNSFNKDGLSLYQYAVSCGQHAIANLLQKFGGL